MDGEKRWEGNSEIVKVEKRKARKKEEKSGKLKKKRTVGEMHGRKRGRRINK